MNIEERDKQYDPQVKLIGSPAATPGYHTKIKDGTFVHHTRESLDYALACLQAGDAMRIGRAHDIIDTVLSLQETDPMSPTFGIWSWFYEEPLAQMNPPDWNWADFLGARLSQMIVQFKNLLDALRVHRMLQSIERAAMAIFRRNSPVSYTNIAVMGAGVCAAAGELLDHPVLLSYGRNKLQAVLELAKKLGAFNEYNSPTYTMVAIEECERILVMTSDPSMHEIATQLLFAAWKMVADHWHSPTGQWAGPHGRAYTDRVSESTLERIEKSIGERLPGRDARSTPGGLELIPPQPCPAELAIMFTQPLTKAREVTMNLGGMAEGVSKVGKTWLSPAFALGSVNREHTWNQRRPVIGYWRGGNETAVFKVQWLMDGRDMPCMRIAASQNEGRLLLSLYPLFGGGPFHPNFDVPPDSTFHTSDLRLRFSVDGPSAMVTRLSPSRFDLKCGDHRVVLDFAESFFAGRAVRWALHQTDHLAAVDAVCVDTPQAVNFESLKMRLAAGIQLLSSLDASLDSAVKITDDGGDQRVDWPASGVEALNVPNTAQRWTW